MKSLSGTRNLVFVLTVLSFSREPLSLYAVAKEAGISVSAAKRVLDRLVELGHVIRLDDGRFVVNPDYIYVYDGIAIYRYSPEEYLLILPSYDSVDDEELFKRIVSIKESLPASVRLWIEMEPASYDSSNVYKPRDA